MSYDPITPAELFKPIEWLLSKLRFERENAVYQIHAIVNDKLYGSASLDIVDINQAAMSDWRQEIRIGLLRSSASVILQTACGCDRRAELSDPKDLVGYLVPIRAPMKGAPFADKPSPFDAAAMGWTREFRWDRHSYNDSWKVLSEVVKRF